MKRGKTPVLSAEEARKPLDSIESNTLIGLRDRALIGAMVYSFARVGATVTMRVGDYFQHHKRSWLRLHEKAGKRHEVPYHPSLEEFVLERLGRGGRHRARQERAAVSQYEQGHKLTDNPMTRFDVLHMIKRRDRRDSLRARVRRRASAAWERYFKF